MVDMHSHLLFGVDDGTKTIEDALCIVEKAVRAGITDMIATPHAFNPRYHVSAEKVNENTKLLVDAIRMEDLPINIHMGQEVRLHEQLIRNLNIGEAMTLAGSRYLLLELPSHSIPFYTANIIQSVLSEGKIPIIAHPERNRAIAEKPERLERLVRLGALAQVTAGSLSGYFGKKVQKLALELTKLNLIHTYGSDVHDLKNRPFLFNEGLDYLEKKKHHNLVDILLENNERILKDEALIISEPETPVLRKWWKLIDIRYPI